MRALVTAVLLVIAAPAHAEQPPSPAEQAQAERIFKAMPATAGVWTFEKENAALRHDQSGLRCRALYPQPQIELLHLSNSRSPNGPRADVGCDYGRLGRDGRVDIMLSVYAEKTGPGETLDSAFQRSRADLLEYYEDARSKGPFRIAKDGGRTPVEEHSEAFETTINKVRTRVSLTVSLVNGWIVEVRATYRGDVANPSLKTAASVAWGLAVESIKAETK